MYATTPCCSKRRDLSTFKALYNRRPKHAELREYTRVWKSRNSRGTGINRSWLRPCGNTILGGQNNPTCTNHDNVPKEHSQDATRVVGTYPEHRLCVANMKMKTFKSKWDKLQSNGENCVIICTTRQLLHYSSQPDEGCGCSTQQARWNHTIFLKINRKRRDHLEYTGVEATIILK